MNTQRYQIYLQTDTVATLDEIASGIGLNRSRLIRDFLDRTAILYAKITTKPKPVTIKDHPLMKMAGFIKDAPSNLSTTVDEIYLND